MRIDYRKGETNLSTAFVIHFTDDDRCATADTEAELATVLAMHRHSLRNAPHVVRAKHTERSL